MATKHKQHHDFFAVGIADADAPMLDHFKYRGKGRPRKKDYSPLTAVLKKLNTLQLRTLQQRMNEALFGKPKVYHGSHDATKS